MRNFLVLAIFILASCQASTSDDKKRDSKRYPNDDAPLAWLMREMFEDMEDIKASVERGEQIKSYVEKHQELLTLRGTEPHKSQQASFQVMGNGYLESLNVLESSDEPEELLSNYQTLVNSCLACHTNYCPGPMQRIRKLEMN
ncbi:hypothetical protein KI659_14850 [Litoribacter alkaliphilus]|uniref:Cytochrome C n=1 Tax=Litoribacter ruber TaxID=702568 RepID=A0AAP2CJW8_9BACT|nr:hypothetical protein [Litoribacter alkaliphilus]MBS9525295.1 hypothetical protein [Litoribacter alkaliphilus]